MQLGGLHKASVVCIHEKYAHYVCQTVGAGGPHPVGANASALGSAIASATSFMALAPLPARRPMLVTNPCSVI